MTTETTTPKYVVSSSPHTHEGSSVKGIMRDVIIAMTPILAASIILFGTDAIRLVVTCVVSCLVTELLCRKAMGRDAGISDLSAVVTGMLLAFNLPPSLPTWMAIAGSVVSIAIAKQVFGGIGYNPFNPALIGRAFLLISFTGRMTTWHAANLAERWSLRGLPHDALTSATPLGVVREIAKQATTSATPEWMQTMPSTLDLFLGNIGGCIGEVSALAILLGAAYMLWRRCITWHTPISYLGTMTVIATIAWLAKPSVYMPPQFHLLAGGAMLGAWFMATDMVTSPVTRKGQILFGIGCGVITMVIRLVSNASYPEGVSFAILLMNAVTPLINRGTRPRIFGTTGKKKA
jgi:electron transport complex protein RnfD